MRFIERNLFDENIPTHTFFVVEIFFFGIGCARENRNDGMAKIEIRLR